MMKITILIFMVVLLFFHFQTLDHNALILADNKTAGSFVNNSRFISASCYKFGEMIGDD